MIIYILLIIAPYLQKSDTLKIEYFDRAAWKTDSIGCQGKRDNLAKILTSNKEKIFGYTKKRYRDIFGKAELNR